MPDAIKYTIFKTAWGYFGLAANESCLLRTHLPSPRFQVVKRNLLANFPAAKYDRNLLESLQKRIISYFDGRHVEFDKNLPVRLGHLSGFANQVLTACRNITLGQTIGYAALAQRIGRPSAYRAVGGVLAKNPLPLIIPCHRVIRSDGKIGGFSASGGIKLKQRMLHLEKTFSCSK